MAIQYPSITRQWAQGLLPERSNEEWANQDEAFANRGYALCSFGDARYVNPRFIREVNGQHVAVCPDTAGRHRGLIGPSAFDAFQKAYSSAVPLFANDVNPTLDEVRAALIENSPVMLLRDAIDQGLIVRRDRATTAVTAEEARQMIGKADEAPKMTKAEAAAKAREVKAQRKAAEKEAATIAA